MSRIARRVGALVCGAVLLLQMPLAVWAEPTPEYLIKAAYLYNFALFVEWPADAFTAPDAPLVVGVIGTDPFEQALERTFAGKRVERRPVIAKRLAWGQDVRQCHIVFVSAADAARIPELTARVGTLPILVVGESPDFARRGGTVNFTIHDNKVRFEVNVDAARRARLKISAKLLNLASIVGSR